MIFMSRPKQIVINSINQVLFNKATSKELKKVKLIVFIS